MIVKKDQQFTSFSGIALDNGPRRSGFLAKAAIAIACATALSACSSLGSDGGFNKRIYGGAGVLVSQLEPDTSGVSGIDVDESISGGAGLLLGYDINDRFSIEGHIADLGESTLSPDGSIAYQVAGLSGVMYGANRYQDRAMRRGFSLFGRLGVGTLDNEAEMVSYNRVNDAHLLAGVGLEYGFDNGLATRAELVAHETDAKYFQLAFLYRFGGHKVQRVGSQAPIPSEPVPQEISAAPVPGTARESARESGIELTPLTLPRAEVITAPTPEPSTVEQGSLPVDNDLDGVTDDIDACPGTASGLPVDATGCELFNGAVEGINFLSSSAELTDGAITALAGVVKALRDFPTVKVTIEAHTDNSGDAEANLQLSKRRALAVARYLVDQGISGLRLKPQAYGESQPRASNATQKGKAANRRVEFAVFK